MGRGLELAPHFPLDFLCPQHPREQLLSGTFSPGCDLGVWKLQENKVDFLKSPQEVEKKFHAPAGFVLTRFWSVW